MTNDQLRLADAMSVASSAAARLRLSIGPRRTVVTHAIDGADVAIADTEALDAFVQRFQQMVEHLTHRLYPAIYRIAQGERAPFIGTMLVEFEGFGIVESAGAWQVRLELRNRLVHEYPLSVGDRAVALHSAIAQSTSMLADFDRAMAYIDKQSWLEQKPE